MTPSTPTVHILHHTYLVEEGFREMQAMCPGTCYRKDRAVLQRNVGWWVHKLCFNMIRYNRNHDLPSLLSFPISVGSVPVIILPATFKLYVLLWLPSSVGIDPVSSLFSKSSNASSATKQQEELAGKTRHVKQKEWDVLDRLTKIHLTHPLRNGSC